MGNDGGSVAKRDDLVKLKAKEKTASKEDARNARWLSCTLSKYTLKEPVVACELGNLYNKEEVIKMLLEKKGESAPQEARHIRKAKDVTTLNLTRISATATSEAAATKALFQCPITLVPMNGMHRFSYLRTCGCVFAEKALKNSTNVKECMSCNKPFSAATDVVPIYGDADEVDKLREHMEKARADANASKGEKRKAPESGPSSSSSKAPRVEVNGLNSAAIIRMAEQQVAQMGTATILKSLAQPAGDAASSHMTRARS